MEICFATLWSWSHKDPDCKYLCEAEFLYGGGESVSCDLVVGKFRCTVPGPKPNAADSPNVR